MNYCTDLKRKNEFIKVLKKDYRENSIEMYAIKQYLTIISTDILSKLENKVTTNEFDIFMKNIKSSKFMQSDIDKVKFALVNILEINITN